MKLLTSILCASLVISPLNAQTTSTRKSHNPQLTSPSTQPGVLPPGTAIRMKLETGVSTAVNKVGDQFAGRVTEDVNFNGQTIIPVGSSISGTVTKVDEKRRYRGRPILELRPEVVTLPNGDKFNIVAVLTETDPETGTKVDSEGKIKGSGIDRTDKIQMVAGTAGGAGFGALVAHSGKGAFIGALVGGGAAVGYWLSKRKSASIEAGSEIMMELSRPMTLNAVGD
jgi:hypothetical protein